MTKLRLVYYPTGEEENAKKEPLSLNKSNFDQFVYTFPGQLPLEEGVAYDYYFEVFDNDAIHNFKSSKSGVYSFRKLTDDELQNEQLKQQDANVKDLDKTLEKMKEQDKSLEELSKTQKEKKELNWNDKKKLENFIKRQKQQEQMMKNFSKEMKENLENFQPEEKDDPFKEQLEDRLQENEERLEENEKLLDELEKLQEKIQKEDLTEKLEQLAKQNKNQEKNLEQLVELTKRYYVTKKAEKLAEDLYKLGEEQEQLSKAPEEDNTKEAQEELNKKFEEYKEDKKQLEKDNEDLKEPMDLPKDEIGEKVVDKEQQNASEKLEQQQKQDAQKSQQKAGEKMKEMGKQMQMQMQAGQMETIQEDVKMLRQILDNLIVFSFGQEDLMEEFKTIDYGSPVFGKKLNIQNDLKLNFEHLDDSIFALSLRQPMISGKINSTLTEIQYNIDKSLDRLAQNQMRQGVSSQQYTVTGANELAIMLSELLNNMQNQMMMSASGQGQGQGFQLPDIIKKQESLSEQMKEGMEGQKGGEKGEKEGQGQGEGKGEGKSQGEGENGQGGEGGNQGQQDGESGNGNSEQSSEKLYEIYKQQQMLRQQLEDRLNKEGLKGKGGDLLREMEGVEQQLLEKGFNQETLQRMLNLQHQLLKLDKASFEQGEENRRESETNRNHFSNNLRLSPEAIKKYFNTTEILNREALPLQPQFKEKVQTYFKQTND